MSWGEVELEPEVRDWFLSIDVASQARARFHVDRLAEVGPMLDEPHTRQLDGKLRELRFFLDGSPDAGDVLDRVGTSDCLADGVRQDAAT